MPARAQTETMSHPVTFAVDLGYGFPSSDRFLRGGLIGPSPLAYAYLGAELHVDLTTHVAMGLSAGFTAALGRFAGGSVRLTQPWGADWYRGTAGLGPAYASNGSLLAVGDAGLELRSHLGVAVLIGPVIAVALNTAGADRCGVDTCEAYVPPGSYLVFFRLGLGLNN